MVLEEAINKLVRDSVNLVLETPGYTIRSKQRDAPRPQGAYAVVDFLASESLGWEQRIFENNEPYEKQLNYFGFSPDATALGFGDLNNDQIGGKFISVYQDPSGKIIIQDLTEYISGLRNITMSINFYRANAMDNSRKVRIGLVRESIQSLFSYAGVGLVSRSEVRDIDSPTDDGWEERSQFDLVLNTVATDQDIVRSIQAIDMASEFQYRGLKYNFNTEV